MKKLILILLIAVLSLTGCGGKDSGKTVNVYNWGEYIDKQVIEDFEKETGIKVKYDIFVTNEDMYVKLKKGGSDFDIIVPSDYMIEKMINEDMLEELDLTKIPNISNLDPNLLNMSYDPGDKYSVPYLWGTVGILYNKTMVTDPVDSWDILWNKKYENQIVMLDSSRDAIGIALKKLGYSMNTTNQSELDEAKAFLIKQKPLVLAYQVDQTRDMMISGEAALAVMYSGSAYDAARENPDLEFAIPKEGTNLWFDAAVIPKGAKNKENAEAFINYLCRPEVAAKIAEFVGYSTPNVKAKELLPAEMQNSEIVFPDLKKYSNLEVFVDPGEMVKVYDQIWTDVIAE